MKKLGRFIRHLIFGVIWSLAFSILFCYFSDIHKLGVGFAVIGTFLGTVFYLLTTLWLDWKAEHSVTFTRNLLNYMIGVKVVYPLSAALAGPLVVLFFFLR